MWSTYVVAIISKVNGKQTEKPMQRPILGLPQLSLPWTLLRPVVVAPASDAQVREVLTCLKTQAYVTISARKTVVLGAPPKVPHAT